mmetsp:Transcript_20344/g.58982  ORF Transcript_20344/g.58982 Transcript_20344/m.58982 type:complete len:297 (+) Transcript_20344:842-1732(+)
MSIAYPKAMLVANDTSTSMFGALRASAFRACVWNSRPKTNCTGVDSKITIKVHVSTCQLRQVMLPKSRPTPGSTMVIRKTSAAGSALHLRLNQSDSVCNRASPVKLLSFGAAHRSSCFGKSSCNRFRTVRAPTTCGRYVTRMVRLSRADAATTPSTFSAAAVSSSDGSSGGASRWSVAWPSSANTVEPCDTSVATNPMSSISSHRASAVTVCPSNTTVAFSSTKFTETLSTPFCLRKHRSMAPEQAEHVMPPNLITALRRSSSSLLAAWSSSAAVGSAPRLIASFGLLPAAPRPAM